MKDYIAIKKSKGSSTTQLLQQAGNKRDVQRVAALGVDAREADLAASGLKKISVRDAVLADDLLGKGKSGYSPLPYMDGYLLRLTDSKFKKTQKALGKDFHIIPNIKLTIPHALDTKIRGSKPMQNLWSEASGIAKAHAEGITGTDVIVAVLDTGCDADHVQFKDRGRSVAFRYYPPEAPQRPRAVRGFDTHGHGTHVSAIIAGNSVGVAPDVDLMVASVIESEQVSTSLLRIVAALEWVMSQVADPANQHKPAILNMSLGFFPEDLAPQHEKSLHEGMKFIIKRLIEDFEVLPIVAIGNEGKGNYRIPGIYPDVLSVGAVNGEHLSADFSGSGTTRAGGKIVKKPDLVGYGVDVYSAFERTLDGYSKYAQQSGTSMATPYVAGIAALLAQKTGLKGLDLKDLIINNALALDGEKHDNERVGYGLARYK